MFYVFQNGSSNSCKVLDKFQDKNFLCFSFSSIGADWNLTLDELVAWGTSDSSTGLVKNRKPAKVKIDNCQYLYRLLIYFGWPRIRIGILFPAWDMIFNINTVIVPPSLRVYCYSNICLVYGIYIVWHFVLFEW